MNNIEFIDILDVDDDLKEKVRQWRNSGQVNRFMLNRHAITKEEHSKWIEGLESNAEQKLWIVFVDKTPIGSVYLKNPNYNQLISEWGFYIGEGDYRGRGFGKRILYKFLENFFESMGFKVLNTKVLSDNAAALHIYSAFGFIETGRTTSEDSSEVVELRFSRAEWMKHKEEIANGL
jgi:UDP-4-amino-4,6-dideoxy-N-acetyl-beta-L-altrosamine N-acetyltransferase